MGSGLQFNINSDITGNGELNYYGISTNSFIVNKVGAFGFTGDVKNVGANSFLIGPIIGDFSNANVFRLLGVTGGVSTFQPYATSASLVYKFGPFEIYSDFDHNITVNESVNNPDKEYTNHINFHAGSGNWTLIYIRGTGTSILSGSGKTCDFNNATVEDLNITGSYTMLDSFIANDIAVPGTMTLTPGKTYACNNISGAGTLTAASLTFITYDGDNTFTGTLNNVVLVKNTSLTAGGLLHVIGNRLGLGL